MGVLPWQTANEGSRSGRRHARRLKVDAGHGNKETRWRLKMARRAALTAYGPMVVVTAEQSLPAAERVVSDELASRFLPFPVPGLLTLTRWAPLRNWIFTISGRRGGGVWASVLCRKRCIDDQLAQALRSGVESVVILGAGLDTHAYRSSFPRAVSVFETDLPENIEYKRKKVEKLFGEVPSHVRLVPVDFDTQDLEIRLASQGYRTSGKAFFLWEAVTQYVSEAGVRKTMDFLSKAGRGSHLVFTYIREDFLQGTNLYGLEIMHKEYRGENPIWKFGLAPEKVSAFLQEYGWKGLEQLGGREYATRYLEPLGRTMPVTEIERIVYAEKT
jgi:methyltransferase (TIGR00027 family)